MNLPNNTARCDGLLPKNVRMPDGSDGLLWSIDCQKRDQCSRYCQTERDGPDARMYYVARFHGPSDACLDFIPEKTGE